MRYRFTASCKLKKTDDFSSVFSFRRRIVGQYLAVHYMPNSGGFSRLGLVVGKRLVRRAHDRNYIKRVLRETFRTHPAYPSVDIVIRVQRFFDRAVFCQVESELVSALAKISRVCGERVP